jgi:hypothetical protein
LLQVVTVVDGVLLLALVLVEQAQMEQTGETLAHLIMLVAMVLLV